MPFTCRPFLDRLVEKFDVDASGCWIWTASTRNGYGQVRTPGRAGTVIGAHRAMYIEIRGAIADGLDLDHLCRNTLCVNPDHLEPVTRRENITRGTAPAALNARKSRCKAGHDLGPAQSGRRACPCNNLQAS